MKFGCSAILYLFLLSSLIAGCAGANHKSVVFDLSHKEIFSPRQKTGMSYVDLAQKFTDAGFTTKIQDRKITQESLKTANVLVLGGPMTPFSDQELKDIAGFVSDGGKLLVMLHISQPASALIEVFGIQATAVIVRQDIDQIDGSNQNFFASRTENHPLTEGVKKIGLFGTWGLRGDPRVGAQMIVSTAEEAFADLDQNSMFTAKEPRASFGAVGVNSYGQGKVVVVSDDAPLIDSYLNVGDNAKLADNIVRWFDRED